VSAPKRRHLRIDLAPEEKKSEDAKRAAVECASQERIACFGPRGERHQYQRAERRATGENRRERDAQTSDGDRRDRRQRSPGTLAPPPRKQRGEQRDDER